eukprot:PhM_4_TR16567/c0_g1_i1/m.88341
MCSAISQQQQTSLVQYNAAGRMHNMPNFIKVGKTLTRSGNIRFAAVDERCSADSEHKNVCLGCQTVQYNDSSAADLSELALRLHRAAFFSKVAPHENVLCPVDVYVVQRERLPTTVDIYTISPLMQADMHIVIRSQQSLSNDHVRYFMFQLLSGMHHMHTAGIVHNSLRPSSLLVNSDCTLRIKDSNGSFCTKVGDDDNNDDDDDDECGYVACRWYKAPEVLLMPRRRCATPADIWSAGCIFAELHRREPLFPGRDYLSQLGLIFSATGTPNPDVCTSMGIDGEALQYIKRCYKNNRAPSSSMSLEMLLTSKTSKSDPLGRSGADLLQKMLSVDPAMRPSAAECLEHPYFDVLLDEGEPEPCSVKYTLPPRSESSTTSSADGQQQRRRRRRCHFETGEEAVDLIKSLQTLTF